MNVLQDCKNELVRVGRTLKQVLQAEGQQCQCNTQVQEVSASTIATCGCGQDACQIGDGPNTCKPQNITLTERV